MVRAFTWDEVYHLPLLGLEAQAAHSVRDVQGLKHSALMPLTCQLPQVSFPAVFDVSFTFILDHRSKKTSDDLDAAVFETELDYPLF